MKFRRMMPHPALQHYIRGYWYIESGPEAGEMSLVPDGYPELFFTLQNKLECGLVGEKIAVIPKSGLIGQLTSLLAIRNWPSASVLYVKMYPWTPHLLFGTPQWQLNDQFLELEALTGDTCFRDLARNVHSCESIEESVALIDGFLLKKLMGINDDNAFLRHAIHQIFSKHGAMNVDCLTGHIHASRRYVEKLFKKSIGVSPKRYARLIRVKKASMFMLDQRFNGGIHRISSHLGYYDQSHFLKDFKLVTGQAPTKFLQARGVPFDRMDEYLGQWDYS